MDKLIKSEKEEAQKEVKKYEDNNYIFTTEQAVEVSELISSKI